MPSFITSRGFIKSSGTTVENEPIVKSDGTGEVMQWKPSDDGADGIFVEEVSGIGGLSLGVGRAPVSNLSVLTTGDAADDADQSEYALMLQKSLDDTGIEVGLGFEPHLFLF